MEEALLAFIARYGYAAIFVLMFFNGLISGPPSELTLGLGGVWAETERERFIPVILVGSAGNLLGTFVLYLIGRAIGYRWLVHLRSILVSTKGVAWFGRWMPQDVHIEFAVAYIRRGNVSWLCYLRCCPTIRSIISLPAGVAAVRIWRFLILSGVGVSVWSIAWVSVGLFLFQAWKRYEGVLSWAFIAVFVTFLWVLKTRLTRAYNAVMADMTEKQAVEASVGP
ncbi:MAG: VTT domain-containing protein [Planctomycetota bacterium]|nr:VTT domain-containing protein [Planctomycetota bacterium]